MKLLCLLPFLFQKIPSLCNVGCLKCTPDSNCLICDVNNNYFLQMDSCHQQSIPDCQIMSQSGLCLVCKPQFFYDSSH